MSRSVWKGPFVDPSLIKKVDKLKDQINKPPIKTWSRKSTIIPEFIGFSFLIHNGKKFIPIKISEEMVGHRLGEFSPTRQFSGHTPADKKAAQTSDTDKKSLSTGASKPGVSKPETVKPTAPSGSKSKEGATGAKK
jgi:small subunit ribosomal protein S19